MKKFKQSRLEILKAERAENRRKKHALVEALAEQNEQIEEATWEEIVRAASKDELAFNPDIIQAYIKEYKADAGMLNDYVKLCKMHQYLMRGFDAFYCSQEAKDIHKAFAAGWRPKRYWGRLNMKPRVTKGCRPGAYIRYPIKEVMGTLRELLNT